MRRRRSGFTLLEAMIALAIAALCVALTLETAYRLQRAQSDGVFRTQLQEFALSVFDGYRVLGPDFGTQGKESGGWIWSLTITQMSDPDGRGKALGLAYLEVTAVVRNSARPDLTVTETEIIARRADEVVP